MGVKDFTKFVKRFAPGALQTKKYSDFRGQVWAIDASFFFYKFCHNPYGNKKENPHVDGFYQLIMRLLKEGIYPVIILDGKKPKQKIKLHLKTLYTKSFPSL